MNNTLILEEDYDLQSSIDYMTKSHLRNVMQLAVFTTTGDKFYAINISKIQSFIIKDEIEILKPPTENRYIIGMINIRGDIVSIVDFDSWVGEESNHEEQKIIIVCSYNQKKIGIAVKEIIRIEEKASDELRVPTNADAKISYVTDIKIKDDSNEQRMCIVFDAEKLLYDSNGGEDSAKTTIYDIESFELKDNNYKIDSNKLVLVAEDSQIVIEKLREYFKKLELNFLIFENGEELINKIKTLKPEDIGLVITDIEMPIRNGYQVIKYIKQDSIYANTPVLSLTSMTNRGVYDKIIQLGAIDLINKSDLETLHKYIKDILENSGDNYVTRD
jgi:two-component system chemotaxis response regulator CheV